MKIYVRLVKGVGFYDRIIKWYTRSNYTHAEFAWPLTSSKPEQWLGAQPKGGVAIRPADYLGAVEYQVYSIDVTNAQARKIAGFLKAQIGMAYDWPAIVNMGKFDHDVISPNKWFCSELVFGACAANGAAILRAPLSQRDRITPRDLGLSMELVPAG